MSETRPYLVAGAWRTGDHSFEVTSPYDGSVVARIGVPTDADVEEAVAAASETFEESRKLPVHARAEGLMHVSRRLRERGDEVAEAIAREGGKPLKWAKVEAARAVSTFRWAAEEARHGQDEVMRLDTEASLGSRLGIVRRFALGPVLGISPFNFPVNLVAHKLAPALAVGAPIVLKPASATPLGALILGELFAETELPKGMVSVLPLSSERAEPLLDDDRFKKVSFTGSGRAGWYLKEKAPKKHFTLELGGNAGVIVDKSADLDWAVRRILVGGFSYAGQVCISVQRMYVHEAIWDEFMARFVEGAKAIKVGDPIDPQTEMGPMVDAAAASRTQRWVDEAVELGGKLLTGGKADGTMFPPTILTDVPLTAQVCSNEAFAPLVVAFPFSDFDEAVGGVNDSSFGLQTGVFTNDLGHAWQAFGELEVGGVIVNDVPTYRIDHMPYGGVKDSGLGREGLRWAIEDMTEIRIMVLAQPG
jgi:aldehyde dehydrogenase (NAD+)